jgi:hypothetical protein
VGDLNELEPAPPRPGATDPAQIDQAVLMNAALDTLAELITQRTTGDDQP